MEQEKKRDSMLGRRMVAQMIDFFSFVLAFFILFYPIHTIFDSGLNVSSINEQYNSKMEEYYDIQEEYGIYYYDEENNRVYNENVTEEVKQQFLNDQRILTLNTTLVDLQKKILTYMVYEVVTTTFVISLIFELAIPLILQRGRTLGKVIMKIAIVEETLEDVKWYKYILRWFLKLMLNGYLGVLTLSVLPLVNLVVATIDKDNKCLYDKVCKVIVVDSVIPVQINKKYNDNI